MNVQIWPNAAYQKSRCEIQNALNVRFRNALSALAGLFRYREVNRYALLAKRDPVAQQLLDRIEKIVRLLRARRANIPLFEEKLTLTASIKDYLNGGGDSDILIKIENIRIENMD